MKEQALLRRLRHRDTAALEQVIEEYSGYVSAVIRAVIGSSMTQEDVEESASDVFFTLWQQAEQVRPGKLKAYLSAIARHKALNKLRERGETLELEEDILLESPCQPEQLLTAKEQNAIVNATLMELGHMDREIFLRHYYYCQSVMKISEAMRINPSTIKSRLSRGRRKLKELLNERGFIYEN